MSKKKINAREAAADIRAGMDDDFLMKKYQLAPPGLQSLIDKLVGAGYLDLAEIEGRLPAFLGSVRITNPLLSAMESEGHAGPRLEAKPAIHVNAYEMARDIRSGIADSGLLRKYHLSSRELQSTFGKLVRLGIITQDDLDGRFDGVDNTVDLREDMLSVTRLLKLADQPVSAAAGKVTQPERRRPAPLLTQHANRASGGDRDVGKPDPRPQKIENVATRWYHNPITTVLLLISFFPLGFYALYLNSRMSGASKCGIAVAWTVLLVVGLVLVPELSDWKLLPGFWKR
ncbi:MAG: hypothetical protein AB1646_01625 [Thermodesulfobacteriota bacterium]